MNYGGIMLAGNESMDMDIYFTNEATFKPGNYRLCKEFNVNNTMQMACADFTIK